MKQKSTNCKYCGSELLSSSNICPACRKYQGSRNDRYIPLFIIIGVIVFLKILFVLGSDSREDNTYKASSNTEAEQVIDYKKCDIADMLKELDDNALKASKKYKGEYIEITGKLNTVDSDGKYISVLPNDDDWHLSISDDFLCYIKSDDQTNKILELKRGDTLTIKGRVTSVGEVLGYYLDMDKIE